VVVNRYEPVFILYSPSESNKPSKNAFLFSIDSVNNNGCITLFDAPVFIGVTKSTSFCEHTLNLKAVLSSE